MQRGNVQRDTAARSVKRHVKSGIENNKEHAAPCIILSVVPSCVLRETVAGSERQAATANGGSALQARQRGGDGLPKCNTTYVRMRSLTAGARYQQASTA